MRGLASSLRHPNLRPAPAARLNKLSNGVPKDVKRTGPAILFQGGRALSENRVPPLPMDYCTLKLLNKWIIIIYSHSI